MRKPWIGMCLAMLLVACGSGSLTMSGYASQVEALVSAMEEQFASLDKEWESQTPSLEGAGRYWEGRLVIRQGFLKSIGDLDPPKEIADMHANSLDIFDRITAADEALAARVATLENLTEHREWLDLPEGQATEAVLAEVYAFCQSAQNEFDATRDGESFAVESWLRSEVEAVRVAFGCPP